MEWADLEQALVGRLRHLGDGAVRLQRLGFPRDGRHGAYLSALYDRERASRSAPFRLHAPNEYAPKPGDLVCTGTAGPTWRFSDPRTAHRRLDNTANHCDIVTDVRGGYVQAIGGNVKNSVAMSLYPVDSRGRLVPVGGRSWLVVVEKTFLVVDLEGPRAERNIS
jgi:hypothetical protein